MALHHANPGEVVDLVLGEFPGPARATALVKTHAFEAIRLALAAGDRLAPHHVPGECTLQCLAGRVSLSLQGRDAVLSAGQWLYLEGGAPHSVDATEDSVLLLTILLSGDAGR